MPSQSPTSTPPPTSPPLLLLSMTSHGLEYPFGQSGSAVPAVSPPGSPCTPSLLAGRAGQGEELNGPRGRASPAQQ